jgi:toxin FitB
MNGSRWLLDTNVVSEIAREQPSAQVVQWLQENIDRCVLCGVSVGEIEFGLQRLPQGKKRQKLQMWFDQIRVAMAERMVGTSVEAWQAYGRMRNELLRLGRPQADMDILIAATALTHRLTLVTRNTKHFEDTGCELLNPWEEIGLPNLRQ